MITHIKPSYLFPTIGILIAVFGVLLLTGQVSASPGTDRSPVTTHSIDANPARPAATNTPSSCDVSYSISQSFGATITDPGTDLVPGSQCDDCGVDIALPFPYTLYDQTFTDLVASSNGQLDFGNPANRSFNNACLPDPYTNYAIFPSWIDLSMISDDINCNFYPGYPQNCGIFTSVTGTEPNRVFNIEYRAIHWDTYGPVHFEVRLYENQTHFEIVYAELNLPANRLPTIGVESTGSAFTSYQCPGSPNVLVSGLQLNFDLIAPCSTPTETPFGTATDTPTYTPTNTPSNTRTNTPTSVPTNTATNTSVPTNTPTLTGTAVPGAVIVYGHVLLQGRPAAPNPRWVVPIAGMLRPASGGVNYSFATVTDQSGYFTVNTNLPPGDYLWYVKNPQTLANSGSATLLADTPNTIEMGALREADANNDNCVTVQDFNILKPTYGRSLGDSGYDARADFNGDNQVSALDFNLLKPNFSSCGALPPSGDTPTVTSTPPPAVVMVGHITVQGRPAQPNARQSVPVSVTLHISGGSANQYDVITDPSGFFTITAGLVPGSYSWRVKNAQTLANAGSISLVGSTNNVEMGLLLEGDANNDNCVNGRDFGIVSPAYGKSLGEPGYDPRADFNGDTTISAGDFGLLRGNFGSCGAGPISPGR